MIDVASYLGIPYVADGRSRDGADCLGLALLIQADLGREIPPPEGVTVDGGAVPDLWWQHWQAVDGDPLPGDVIQTQRQHRGVSTVIDARHVITTRPATGVCVLRLDVLLRAGGLLGIWRAR